MKIRHMTYLKELRGIVLPIIVQNLINAVVNAADVIMLTSAGAAALGAVSLANQVTFVLSLFYMGISTGVTILAAQYWGLRDTETIGGVQGAALKASVAISALFCVGAVAVPSTLMRLFTEDAALITLGSAYLRILGTSFLATGVSQIALAVIKSTGRAKQAAQITVTGLLVNIVLNAFCLFVLFRGDALRSVCGVAAATVIARLAELIWSIAAARQEIPVRAEACPADVRRALIRCTLPVQANYLVWGCALAATTSIIGHISSDMVSAHALANTLRNLILAGCSGLGAGASILLGNRLGRGDTEGARQIGDDLRQFSIVLGAASGLVLLLLRGPYSALSQLTGGAKVLLEQMLAVNAVYCVGKSFNAAMVGGVFCAGGDTKFGLICDTVVMWGIILPLGAASFYWHWEPIWVYILLCTDEFIKMPFVLIRYAGYRWLNTLTKTKEETQV